MTARARTEGLLQDWSTFRNNIHFSEHVQKRAGEAEEKVIEVEPLFYSKLREPKTQFNIFSHMISTRVDYVEEYGSFSAAAKALYYHKPWVLVYEINASSRPESLTWYTGVENLYAMPKSIFGWFELNRVFNDENFIPDNFKAEVPPMVSEETCQGVASIFNPVDGISLNQAFEALMEA